MSDSEIERFGPLPTSKTDDGIRVEIPSEALEESGLSPDQPVILQPYKNGIHVIAADRSLDGDWSTEDHSDG